MHRSAADDPLAGGWGPDGTQPAAAGDALGVTGAGADALGPVADATGTPTLASEASHGDSLGALTSGDASPVPMPRLPAVPSIGDAATHAEAVERWMADDLAEHRDDPPQAYRVLPTPPEAPRTPPTAARAIPAARPADPRAERVGAEEPWVRERREEQEFVREFGQWRAGSGSSSGMPSRMRPTTLVSPPVLLLGIVVVVILYFVVVR